ncbi:hypothetical protein Q8A57_00165 [Porticoccus litoralis]|uniref:Uncharacterized protein n=1 Tax=Porticoccus litoralis TaxID=434086 RepID=A0AAW8AXJ4_9GAMM|nr:hypothetical protein [Porticoccus litoralis]MDP1519378.1 hypothetical protein [Porticoccus litoralis]
MEKNRTYRILLDGEWTLEDLTNFSRVYFQNYSFLYCLETEAVGVAASRIESVLNQSELRDGLSYVNIYDRFRSSVPKQDRPAIKSIQYASPGWIDLALNPEAAVQFAKVMGTFLASIAGTAATYKKLHDIYLDLGRKRKKQRNELLKLEAEEAIIVQKLNNELAKGLGFESLPELDKHTRDTEETSKLLLAHYRRMKKTAEFIKKGKAKFPEKLHETTDEQSEDDS